MTRFRTRTRGYSAVLWTGTLAAEARLVADPGPAGPPAPRPVPHGGGRS